MTQPQHAPRAPRRGVSIPEIHPEEDVFGYLQRVHGGFGLERYQQLLGAANPYKEGDPAIGLAAVDEVSRANARALLSRTRLEALHEHPPLAAREAVRILGELCRG
jgi:ethanolamine ammonia-lyase large subunit